jgi:hypothetical protein
MKMAVLSSVQHPSIVQAYACLPDMARLPGGRNGRSYSAQHTWSLASLRLGYQNP